MLEAQSPTQQKPRGQMIPSLCHPDAPPKMRPPPVEPNTSSAEANTKDTLPGSAEPPPGDNTMVPLAKADTKTLKDLPTNGATRPA